MDKDQLQRMSLEEKRALLKEALVKNEKLPNLRSEVLPETIPGLFESREYAAFLKQKESIAAWGAQDIYFCRTEGISGPTVVVEGKQVVNFSSYNYLDLAGDPRVQQATREALSEYGTSTSASRIASGEKAVHRELEQALAQFLGTEDSVVMVGGFSTNESMIGHLMNERDLILYDSYIHASIQQGGRLSGATVRAFPHNRTESLGKILEEERHRFEKVLIIVEGVYSMDGDSPDLPEIVRLKKHYQAMLMVDEAHSLGVLGDSGRGIAEHQGVSRSDVDIWMGTLSKSLASCGGYLAGSKEWVEYLKYTVPGFVYSVGLPPASAAAAREAIDILKNEPERIALLRQRSEQLREAFRGRGWDTGLSRDSSIVPLILGDSASCIHLSQKLLEKQILVIPIIHPAVPENAARLRFFVCSHHTEKELDGVVTAIGDILEDEQT